jgi:hypothetical protein
MSLAHYIVLERDIPGFDPFVNGKCVAHASDELEALAKRLQVTPFLEFFSMNREDVAAEFGEPPDGGEYPAEVWYEPEKGLETVNRLLAHLIDNPAEIADSNRVIEELREYQSVLQRLSAERVKWHLAIDY